LGCLSKLLISLIGGGSLSILLFILLTSLVSVDYGLLAAHVMLMD
jgi:hypothetical protein